MAILSTIQGKKNLKKTFLEIIFQQFFDPDTRIIENYSLLILLYSQITEINILKNESYFWIILYFLSLLNV